MTKSILGIYATIILMLAKLNKKVYNVNSSQSELNERYSMDKINERVLESWINLITAIDSERLVLKMPYNEAIICNLLFRNKDKVITATDLCKLTNMQKSQMNRTLTSLENKNLIKRERSLNDKREIQIKLIEDGSNIYQEVHEHNIAIVDKIIERLGKEKTSEVLELFSLITSIAKEEIK